jgi:hypothetical protein
MRLRGGRARAATRTAAAEDAAAAEEDESEWVEVCPDEIVGAVDG